MFRRLATAAAALAVVSGAFAAPFERVPLDVVVNGQSKPAVVGWLDEAGTLWLNAADVLAWGIKPGEQQTSISGRAAVPVRSLGERIKFDESDMRLLVTLSESELSNQTRVNLAGKGKASQLVAAGSGVLMDYEVGVGRFGDSTSLDAQVRTRAAFGGWQLLDDRSATLYDNRLFKTPWRTTLRRDWLDDNLRLDLGTLTTPDGGLSTWTQWRGVSFGTAHYGYSSLQATRASTNLATTVLYPSTADIYVNGVKQGSFPVNPGTFDIQGLRGYNPGSTQVRAVIRDVFGKETVIEEDRYLGEGVVAKGVHEYQYQAGVDEFKQDDGLQLRAAHRLGVGENWTVTARAEASKDVQAVQVGAVTQVAGLGEFGAAVMGGHSKTEYDPKGFSLTHSFREANWSVYSALSSRPAYRFSGGSLHASNVREFTTFASYSAGAWGNYSARLGVARWEEGQNDREVELGWSKNINSELLAQVFARKSDLSGSSVQLMLVWRPKQGYTVNSYTEMAQGRLNQQLTASKQPDLEPVSWRLDSRHQDGQASAGAHVNYAMGAGVAKASVNASSGSNSVRMAWNGGVVAGEQGLTMAATRNDAGVVVQVPGVAGVEVLRNGIAVGRTDAAGKLWVADVPGYEEVRFSLNEGDLPMDLWYAGGAVKPVRVSPGTVASVVFDVRKVRRAEVVAQDCTSTCKPLASKGITFDSEGGVSTQANLEQGRGLVEGLVTGAQTVTSDDGRCTGAVNVAPTGPVVVRLTCNN